MDVTMHIPDDLADSLCSGGADLARRAMEAFALEEYRSGRISKAQLRRLLGFQTRYELDGFLKSHEVWEEIDLDELNHQMQDLRNLVR